MGMTNPESDFLAGSSPEANPVGSTGGQSDAIGTVTPSAGPGEEMPPARIPESDLPTCECGHDNFSHPRETTDAEPAYPCVEDGCECAGWEEADDDD